MSSRGLWVKLGRRSLRSTTIIALVSTLLVVAGAVGLQKVVATRAVTTANSSMIASAGRELGRAVNAPVTAIGTAKDQKVIGVFEGTFDAKTQKVTLLNANSGNLKSTFKAFGRSDASTPLPDSVYTRTIRPGSCALPSTSAACQPTTKSNTVSGEVQINNIGSRKFYNTRMIFTDLLVARGSAQSAESAFFNDGQVAFNGKLGVSREYGDIEPNSSQARIWTFHFPSSSLQSFYFRYTVVADIGVATESVEPAAIQNNSDRSITIHGQGLNNPTVTLLNSSGAAAATLALTATSATQLTATVPANTAAGIYSVQVTNTGETAGSLGSSTLVGRLTVTGVPDGAHTVSGTITSWGDTGPYRINAAATISGTILPGTVIYIDNGVTLQVGSSLNANGGIPGVTTTSPAQIVITASPGAASWGGIDATSTSTGEVSFKNCVVEYGGASGSAQINISGSGRTLRFMDSISRRSGGHGLRATGSSDIFTGFTRSRVEFNGGIAVLLSANAALGVGATGAGMGELGGSNASTTVNDQSYFYSLANVIRNNGTNAVQIDASANDFTRSGVLVGQGDIPIQIRGDRSNPSIVGNSNAAPGAQLTIGPSALIQLDGQMDLQAGNGTLNGNIDAEGYAGYSHSSTGDTGLAQRIVFDRLPGGDKFGALFFSSTSGNTSLLNFVAVRNGGNNSASGDAQVVIGGVSSFSFTNSESSGSASFGLQYPSSTSVTKTNTTYGSGGTGNNSGNERVLAADPTITTIAGGLYGDGNQANQAPLIKTVGMVVDPGRGVYFAETTPGAGGWYIRFANTTNAPLKVAGITVPANSIKNLTSGRPADVDIVIPNNTPMAEIDLLGISGLALSGDKKVLFFTNTGSGVKMVNWINVSPGEDTNPIKLVTSAPTAVEVGSVGTLYNDPGSNLSENLRGIAVNPVTKDVYVADANTAKVLKITAAGSLSTFAGGVARPRPFAWQAFSPGSATGVIVALPQAITVNADGDTVYISDSDFGRVIRVKDGNAALVTQLGTFDAGSMTINSMPAGLTLVGSGASERLYIANSSDHTVVRIDSPGTVSAQASPGSGVTTINTPTVNLIAGTAGTACDYSSSSCGDNGAVGSMTFDLRNVSMNLGSDDNGLFVLDQVGISTNRPRVRYLNLSGSTQTLANVAIAANIGNTVIGSGLASPYDGGLATSAILSAPAGVAADSNGNLFIAESNITNSALRFVNRGSSAVTLLGQTVAPGAIIRINKDVVDSGTDESPTPSTAYFYSLQGLKWTSEGLYIVDSVGKNVPTTRGLRTSKLRFLNLSNAAVTFYGSLTVNPGEIKTIAGGSTDPSSIGDGLIATSAKLLGTTDVEVDPTSKDIYLSEAFAGSGANAANRRVRKILRSTGIISSMSLATNLDYTGLAFDNAGRLLIAAVNGSGGQVLRETAVGSGAFATVTSSIAISKPRDIAVDSSDNLYVVSSGKQQILKLPVAGGTATNFAGTADTSGFAGDGANPTSAKISVDPDSLLADTQSVSGNLMQTVGIIVTASGEVIFADTQNNRVRRVK